MNWPPLTPECSRAIADAIKDAVRTKPKDLFEHVAQQLASKSNLDPAEFERHFEECRRQPKQYVLEERCPAGQDPLSWVPMRYNDDTILLTLQQKAADVVAEILSPTATEDSKALLDSVVTAFPEVMYLRDTEDEMVVFQMIRAAYLALSGSKDVLKECLDDADPRLSYACEALLTFMRGSTYFEMVGQSEEMVEALLISCIYLVLGRNEGFRNRFGGKHLSSEQAMLHAITQEKECLPSFQRLSEDHKQLLTAVMKAYFSLETLVFAEVLPSHFNTAKESLGRFAGGLPFFLSLLLLEHACKRRSDLVSDDDVDICRLASHCLNCMDKYGPHRTYEVYLKKRAERQSWRLSKEDIFQKCCVRLACLTGQEDSEVWKEVMSFVEKADEEDQELIAVEIGRKDGVMECPAFFLFGGGNFMKACIASSHIGLKSGLAMILRLLKDLTNSFEKSMSSKVMRVDMSSLTALAKRYQPGGVPFADTPMVLEDLRDGDVRIKIAGNK
eukprot:TRINITY_DN101433_c0_g1_i1.p1 TRINITY_DN101433_c0_g1~~TRINITY_DN101433_c0_g1_i1.p1  ORF type:complete len:501 (-),score=134.27 TRINITY_DN101433_c0_g1_i1:104-1606(-)